MKYEQAYRRSLEQPEDFWREQAEQIAWFSPPAEVLSRDEEGFTRWFRGGRLNTPYLALDVHVEGGRGDQAALIYDSPVTGAARTLTYRELRDEVACMAGALVSLGIGKGDTVVIYMPMIPEAVIGMLACARIGAIHSVVFGGFAAHELTVRIDDAQPKLLLTASAGKEVDRVIDYLQIVDAALEAAASPPDACVVCQRDFHRAELQTGRDHDWEQLRQSASPVPCVECDATDPLYILYTSGTTGRPKGVIRDNGGHAVSLKYSMQAIYDTQPGDVYWAASDIGWVVGHSYVVYGPLIQGCTTVLHEGKPVRTPDAGEFWRVVEQHRVKTMFTAPTAIRAIKREDPDGVLLKKHDLSELKHLFLAGERCDVPTLQWIQELIRVPVIDHWWQTESGWPMLANMAGLGLLPVKPGSATKPVCGFDVRILTPEGHEAKLDEEGAVAVRLPLPPGCLPNLWRNTPRFRAAYLERFPGYYESGDNGYRDEDGYFFVTGRIDDVIKVAGHRLSTAEIEEAVAKHPAVAECAVVGAADRLKGQAPLGFVVLRSGVDIAPDQLCKELVQMVRQEVGPIASFRHAIVTPRLPKTRSGKILRRVMRRMADGEDVPPPPTIEEPDVLAELAAAIRQQPPLGSKESAEGKKP